jgi:hypothetical protein
MNEVVRRVRIAPVLVLLVIVVVAAALVLWPRTSRFSAAGIAFDVPSSWVIRDELPGTFGMGQTFALIGNMPWGPCDESDINCHYQERFGRHEIEVEVGVMHLMTSDFCTYARERPDLEPRSDGVRVTETHYIRLDGRPAISTNYSLDSPDYYGSDGWRTWEIAPADTDNVMYRISARWRGPGEEAFLFELDCMIQSVRLGPSRYAESPIPDCGDPFPAVPLT